MLRATFGSTFWIPCILCSVRKQYVISCGRSASHSSVPRIEGVHGNECSNVVVTPRLLVQKMGGVMHTDPYHHRNYVAEVADLEAAIGDSWGLLLGGACLGFRGLGVSSFCLLSTPWP